MKITIEPGRGERIPEQHSVTFDTNTNAELTTDAVGMALSALVAYGHHPSNVAKAAIEWGEERSEKGQP